MVYCRNDAEMIVEVPLVGPRRVGYDTLRSPLIDSEQEAPTKSSLTGLLCSDGVSSFSDPLDRVQLVPELALFLKSVPTVTRYVPPEL